MDKDNRREELNVGGGGWVEQGKVMGENGDKCNSTKIKIKKYICLLKKELIIKV